MEDVPASSLPFFRLTIPISPAPDDLSCQSCSMSTPVLRQASSFTSISGNSPLKSTGQQIHTHFPRHPLPSRSLCAVQPPQAADAVLFPTFTDRRHLGKRGHLGYRRRRRLHGRDKEPLLNSSAAIALHQSLPSPRPHHHPTLLRLPCPRVGSRRTHPHHPRQLQVDQLSVTVALRQRCMLPSQYLAPTTERGWVRRAATDCQHDQDSLDFLSLSALCRCAFPCVS